MARTRQVEIRPPRHRDTETPGPLKPIHVLSSLFHRKNQGKSLSLSFSPLMLHNPNPMLRFVLFEAQNI